MSRSRLARLARHAVPLTVAAWLAFAQAGVVAGQAGSTPGPTPVVSPTGGPTTGAPPTTAPTGAPTVPAGTATPFPAAPATSTPPAATPSPSATVTVSQTVTATDTPTPSGSTTGGSRGPFGLPAEWLPLLYTLLGLVVLTLTGGLGWYVYSRSRQPRAPAAIARGNQGGPSGSQDRPPPSVPPGPAPTPFAAPVQTTVAPTRTTRPINPPGSAAPAGPYLEARGVTPTPPVQPIPPEGLTIGRAPDNGLVIDASYPGWDTVSHRHARIEVAPVGGHVHYILVDENSRNGVWVNQRGSREKRLADGDQLRLGEVELIFRLGRAALSSQPDRVV